MLTDKSHTAVPVVPVCGGDVDRQVSHCSSRCASLGWDCSWGGTVRGVGLFVGWDCLWGAWGFVQLSSLEGEDE